MNDDTPSRAWRGNSVGKVWSASGAAGFTIIETMIVVAVSGAMLMSAVLLVAGQQRKVEFNQAVQEIKSNLDQIISEVGTGYYPNPGTIRCVVSGGNVSVSAGNGAAQGANNGCIFLGKVVQFGVGGTDPQQFVTHTVAALQNNDGTLASARPRAIDIADARDTKQLRNGLRAVSMQYSNGAGNTSVGAVAFVSGLGSYKSNQLMSGSQQVSMIPVRGSGSVPNTTVPEVVGAIDSQLAGSPVNPSGGVRICFNSGGAPSALLTIGSNNRSLGTKLDFKTTADCS